VKIEAACDPVNHSLGNRYLFRESNILRHIFERVVAACMVACLVKGEGFAVAGARDEFHLAAIVQNLKTMALRLVGPPPRGTCAAIA